MIFQVIIAITILAYAFAYQDILKKETFHKFSSVVYANEKY
jgi:hypothetical protein